MYTYTTCGLLGQQRIKFKVSKSMRGQSVFGTF